MRSGSLRVVDLFAGAGGFGLGFKMDGHRILASVEMDRWACDTLRYNAAPGEQVFEADIRTINADILAKDLGTVDVVIGGPPCQGFSVAGPRQKDPKDPRNSLFREFSRIVKALNPPVFVMENVPGLLKRCTATGDHVIEVIKDEFASLGYAVIEDLLEARDFGVPQIRQRLFIVGLKSSLFSNPWITPEATHGGSTLFSSLLPYVTLWDAIGDLPKPSITDDLAPYLPAFNDYQRLMRLDSSGVVNHIAMRHTKRLIERFQQIRIGESQSDVFEEHLRPRKRFETSTGQTYDQNNRRMHPDRPCHTLPAAFYANFLHPFEHRNFTPREGARIQSFPDNYVFRGMRTTPSHSLLRRENRLDEIGLTQYNQVGNAVPPLLAKGIAIHIRNIMQSDLLASV